MTAVHANATATMNHVDKPSGLIVRATEAGATIERLGAGTVQYGLAVVIAWIGAMKFTAYEAEAISGFVQNSPLMAWVYEVFSVRGFGAALGTVELTIAGMIAFGTLNKRIGAIGAALATGMFLTTLSFLFTTPGVTESSLGGFPALSVVPGQFLIKDIVLLGASAWLLGRSLRALQAK